MCVPSLPFTSPHAASPRGAFVYGLLLRKSLLDLVTRGTLSNAPVIVSVCLGPVDERPPQLLDHLEPDIKP